jgi:hypothetical protein
MSESLMRLSHCSVNEGETCYRKQHEDPYHVMCRIMYTTRPFEVGLPFYG